MAPGVPLGRCYCERPCALVAEYDDILPSTHVMTEIAQLFESALQNSRASLLRKAAINTVAKMPPTTTLRELLDSEAGASLRGLTIDELREALAGIDSEAIPGLPAKKPAARVVAISGGRDNSSSGSVSESREARLYREILEAVKDDPLTIGQLAKTIDVDVTELRGYLTWMKKMGKIASTGRARATRYHMPV